MEPGRCPPCPPVTFLLESCAGSPFDPTVLAPGRMSELQPHLPAAPRRHPPAFSGVLRIVGALDRARRHPGAWRQAGLLGILMQERLPAAALSGASAGPQVLASREA